MQYVTDAMIAEAINAMEKVEFDTHAVEQYVFRQHTVEFARQILEHEHNDDVLRQFSASFSRRIGDAFPNQVDKVEKVSSANLAGRDSGNQKWRRTATTVCAQ